MTALLKSVITPSEVDEAVIEIGNVRLNRAGINVVVNGVRNDLALREFQLLELLMINAGRALTPEAILELLWTDHPNPSPLNLRPHILRLRQKVEPDPHHPTVLRTIRGVGYMYQDA